ncbi:hypothetical protein BGZ88_005449 [Linnemannia elongata]|uniref:Bet v1-like protein n=1 Tax=Linnemannia elongata AG-77 TaxID=1314771 RepID=A0A197K6P6_9FUNG|nr:hypothetical protein BGZ88_005449 [Linnemannia elongata]KAF9339933.1 hypothetical protein BGZ91_004164 [Linnemannia elongata]KAG0066799.1 hypothetical protein BGZ89_006899 [Linnemannia elongata]KAK5814363.1 hypothetical protein F5H01DRAFT_23902 [Linnemannia elongata]OAQ32843.1 Bet v1-like protein [Linnemannia elongata AG-77]
MLTDQQFQECLAELKVPRVDNWELFLDHHGFKVYRKALPNTALYEYKALGHYPDVPAKLLADVFTDLEYRMTWDKNMVGFKRLDHGVIHYTTKFPWPLSPREYFYEQTTHEPKPNHFCVSSQTVGKTRATDGTLQNFYSSNNYKSMVTLVPSSPYSSPSSGGASSFLAVPGLSGAAASSISLPTPGSESAGKVFKLPPPNKSVRVEEYRQDVVMVPSEDGKGCYVWFGYFDDPKGHIPSSIVNWATKSGIPGFLKGIQDACLRRAATQKSTAGPVRDRPATPDSGIEA